MKGDRSPEDNTGITISDHSKLLAIYSHEIVQRGLAILNEIEPGSEFSSLADQASRSEAKLKELERVTEKKIGDFVNQYRVLWDVKKIADNVYGQPLHVFARIEQNRWEKSKLISKDIVVLYCILSYYWVIDRASWRFCQGYWSTGPRDEFVKHIFVRISSLLEECPEILIKSLIKLENQGFDVRK